MFMGDEDLGGLILKVWGLFSCGGVWTVAGTVDLRVRGSKVMVFEAFTTVFWFSDTP